VLLLPAGTTAWLALLIAGLMEITWALGLKYSDGCARLWPSIGTVAALGLSFVFLGLALKSVPFGTAYAVWTGIGAAGAASAMRATRFASDGEAKPRENSIFASGLDGPFGMAFYPPGPDPQWIYIANTGSVVRYPYLKGPAGGWSRLNTRGIKTHHGRIPQATLPD
jgi:multidrug transporter EmrE-like cation transporter